MDPSALPAQTHCLHVHRQTLPARLVRKIGSSQQGHITLCPTLRVPVAFSSLSPSVRCMHYTVQFPQDAVCPAAYLAVTIGPATAGPARDTVRQFMYSRPFSRSGESMKYVILPYDMSAANG